MPVSTLEEARAFLGARRIAVVGVSRNEKDFSRALFREVVQGLCPFMAFPDAAFPHRAHGFFRRAFARSSR